MNTGIYQTFCRSCENGLLAKAQFLYGTGEIDLDDRELSVLFRKCCRNGHLETAQWLYSLGNIDVRASNDQAICLAYDRGHLDIVKWLCSVCEDYVYQEDKREYTIRFGVVDFVKSFNSKIVDECGDCIICYEKEADIQTFCGHFYCRDCFVNSLVKIGQYNDFNCAYCRQKLNVHKKVIGEMEHIV
jgi:hypothetical protein